MRENFDNDQIIIEEEKDEEDEEYTAMDAEDDYLSSDYETSSEEENEDENEEEEDTSEGESKKKKKKQKTPGKKKRRLLNQFIQEEASEDDEGEEEEFDEEEEDEFSKQFIKKEGAEGEEEEEEEGPTANDYRRLQRERLEREDIDMEAEEERLRQLYGRVKYFKKSSRNTGKGYEGEQVPQQLLLPTESDPKLWLVKCKIGKERTVVHQLLRACLDLQYSESPLQIFSCLARDNLKGYVYVEAHKATQVAQAIEAAHLNHLLFCGTVGAKANLVPLAEMTQVLNVSRIQASGQTSDGVYTMPRLGSLVRIRRGLYGGDLAQVMQIPAEESTDNLANARVQIKLLPRLSFQNTAVGRRPEQKLFDPEEANQHGPVTRSRGYWIYGKESYKNGFLFKDFTLKALQCEQVNPKKEELSKLGITDQAHDEEGDGSTSQEVSKVVTMLKENDKVVITEGEFINLKAVVQQVITTPPQEENGEKERVWYKVQPVDTINDVLEVEASQLSKYFEHGDLVQITNSEKTAMVISCSPAQNSVTVYSAELGQVELPLDAVVPQAKTATVSTKSKDDGFHTLRQLANIPTTLSTGASSEQQSNHNLKTSRGLVGKIVSVAYGPYKGYLGMVKHVDPLQGVKVELQTNSKLITLPPDRVIPLSDNNSGAPSTRAGSRTPGWNSAKTPAWNSSSKTPAWTSKTPAWSSKTPAWNTGTTTGATWGGVGEGKTPSWKDAEGKTPSWKLDGKTPSWKSAKTPSWEPQPIKPSSKTPSWSANTAISGTIVNPTISAIASSTDISTNPPTTVGSGGFIIDGVIVTRDNQEYSIVKTAPSISIKPLDGSTTLEVQESDVKPCRPAKRDRAIIYGDGSMLKGTVIGLDDPEAVVKIDGTGEFKIVKAAFLAKIL